MTPLENKNIQSINNKIKNIFQNILLKHKKRIMKIELGVLIRFVLKLDYLNINNKKEKIALVFERALSFISYNYLNY